MLGGVFISYRREDTGGFAGRIYDRLTNRLGRDGVFFDVDNIPAGLDFVDVLSERVGKCDALVAVIGRAWNPVSDKDNRPRLDDPNDFVRVEIEAALARGIRVIPVLVDGAAMPRADDLPECLKKLVRRQRIEISHTRFNSDVERLTRALSLLEDELRQREAAEAVRAAREERERREAAEAAEKAEQARRLAEAEAQREEEARRANEAAEAERAARVEREKREAAEKAEREKLGAEAAERARQLAEAEAQRQDEERRAREAAEAERAAREEREKQEAAEQAERERLRAEAEATMAREVGAATAKWTGDIGNAVLKPSQSDAPDRALAAAARRRDGRNWPILAAVVGAAILGAALLIAEFGSRHGNTPAVQSNAPAAQPTNAIAAAPAVAPTPEAAAPSETVAPAAPSNPTAARPAVAPTPKAVVQPEPTATHGAAEQRHRGRSRGCADAEVGCSARTGCYVDRAEQRHRGRYRRSAGAQRGRAFRTDRPVGGSHRPRLRNPKAGTVVLRDDDAGAGPYAARLAGGAKAVVGDSASVASRRA